MASGPAPVLPGKWSDLTRRFASTLVLLFIGAMLLLSNGITLRVFIAALVAVTFWELARMTGWRHPEMHATPFGRSRPLALAGLAGASLFATLMGLGGNWDWAFLLIPLIAGLPGALARDRLVFLLFGAAILIVGYQIVNLREGAGAAFMLWLVGIVIVSDIAGYFIGRLVGGAKLWPAVSPKKTWSGTIAGWVGAVVWSLLFAAFSGSGVMQSGVAMAIAAVPISMAGQAGDLAESWLKRRAGVKDSSNLIPGHGGLMDRFDALCGAILGLTAFGAVVTLLFRDAM